MNNITKRIMIWSACIVFVMVLAVGCEEENSSGSSSDIRKHKLIANENRQLKEQLKQCEKEIQEQKGLVEECQQEKDSLDQEWQKKSNKRGKNAIKDFEKMIQLMEENKKLKEQIEALK